MPVPVLLLALASALPGPDPGLLARPAEGQAAPVLRVEPVDGPVERGVAPNLAADGRGRVLLSWVEEHEGAHRLRLATLADGRWSTPETVAAGTGWFVNWADVPALAAAGPVRVAAWLCTSGDDTYAYGIRHSRSRGSSPWSGEEWLHTDRSPGEHGFVSLVPRAEGFDAVWLDGRNAGGGHGAGGAMALYTRAIAPDGTLGDEVALDERVCDCCPTDAVRLDDGALVVVYRDRSEGEMRDVSVVRRAGGSAEWSAPRTVHDDGWEIAGCPVNGPAVAAHDQRIAVAWFTVGREDRPRVELAFSSDGARTFGAPVRVAGERALGRVDAAFLGDGTLVVTWLEATDEGAEWRARACTPDGTLGAVVAVARASGARADGRLHLAPDGASAVAAWPADGTVALARLGP